MFRKCLPFNTVAANTMATLSLANIMGNTLNRLHFGLSGGSFLKSHITGIRLRADTKLIVDTTGSYLDKRNQYKGLAANAAYLTLDFTEPRAKTIIGQKLGAIDTRMLQQLNLEVDIGGATTPALVAWADIDDPTDYDKLYAPAERALMGKCLRQTYAIAAAGKFAVPIPYGRTGGTLIKRIHFHDASGIITDVEVKKNGYTLHESSDGINDFVQGEYQRTPQANMYSLDFIMDGNQSNVLRAYDAQSMEYYLTCSGAGTVVAEIEMLDPLNNN